MSESIQVKSKLNHKNFKIAPFRKNIRKTKPHKHNSYLEIVFLTKAIGFHTIDDIQYQTEPGAVFIIKQDQVHYWDMESQPEGFVIIVKKPFVENSPDPELTRVFGELSSSTYTKITDINSILPYFQLLHSEFNENELHINVLEGLLKSLFAKLIIEIGSKPKENGNRKDEIMKFKSLVIQNMNNSHQIKYYADMLHTTPQNLNAQCRKNSNKSASAIVNELVLKEAKRLLQYTPNNINQISQLMGFKDNSHFTKFFKRHTSTTPKAFREQR